MYLKSNIKFLRTKEKLTHQELAWSVGLERRSDICNYENGYSMPKIRTLIRIAKFFKISIDDLLLKKLKP